jgi:hypothetical protein
MTGRWLAQEALPALVLAQVVDVNQLGGDRTGLDLLWPISISSTFIRVGHVNQPKRAVL